MENGGDDDASTVRVAVRVRPLIGREKVERCDECVSVVEEEMQVVMGKNRSFTYDYVFSKYAQQSDIWRCVDPLVRAHFDGYNATIFAYGQTGSGKTFTMGSGSCLNVAPEDYGIIPRVIGHLFEQVEQKSMENARYKCEFRVRFLEVYGEEIRDLLIHLGEHSGESKVTLREGEHGEVQVMGATEELANDADECLRMLERGTLCRTTGSTLMNAHSSRSHAIFTISMVQHLPIAVPTEGNGEGTAEVDMDGEFETRTSYFNFVDLAGSERQKRTQAEGKRLKEGIDINKGLLALGNVISALGDDKKRGRVHVPYRDSKLTRMLQDSLGGNSRTLMLTCVSPADVNFEETLNTLKYANRARNIKNKPVINRDETSAATAELRRQVQLLQAEVLRLRNPGMSEAELRLAATGGIATSIGMSSDYDSYGSLRSRAETAEAEVSRLTAELKRNRTQMDHLKEEMIAAQAERDYLQMCVEESNSNGSSPSPTNRMEASNVLKQHLRTICELQDQIRAVERERDRALMNLSSSSGIFGHSGAAGTDLSMPVSLDSTMKMNDELLSRAEKEIAQEAAALKKIKDDQSGDDAVASEQSGSEDVDMDTVEEETQPSVNPEVSQEEADRERVFQRRQQHLGQSVQDLSHEISLKEQLVQNIRQNQENYERMKSYYEQKMSQMVEEVRLAQVDRDRLIDEIQQLEAKIREEGDSNGGGNGRLAKLSKDLKAKEAELQGLRKKQTEMNRYMNQKKKSEMQLRVLNAEIQNMKRQKVELIKKMQDERKRFEEEANRRKREIMNLKRAQQRDKQQIQRLGSQKEAQERVLKRKMEEISAAKARLKHQQQLQAQARRMNVAHGRKQSSNNLRDSKWLSEEVKKRAEEQQKLEQLQKERQAVAKEMEALYAARAKLEEDLRKQLGNQNNIRDVLISPLKRISPSPSPNRRLSGPGGAEYELTPEEEQLLVDLEERIEACQAQLEYKEEKISEIAEGDAQVDGYVKIESTQSLPEARTLLKMLFGMAVDVKKEDQRKENEIAKLHMEMAELTKRLDEEQERTQQLKQSYEESVQRLMNSSSAEGTSGAQSPYPIADSSAIKRDRMLLSVSEERNAILRKKCEELELQKRRIDREYQNTKQQLEHEKRALVASRDHIKWLETQLSSLKAPKQRDQGSNTRGAHQKLFQPREIDPADAPSALRKNSFVASSASAASSPAPSSVVAGPVSWANEFDDEDEEEDVNMEVDEEDDMPKQPVFTNSSSGMTGRASGALKPRRSFRVDLDSMGDTIDSISLTDSSRFAHVTSGRHLDEDDSSNLTPFRKEDSPTFGAGSDDSSSTSSTSHNASIFSRLSNPTNFTGIHKNRVKDSASKRELLQLRAERNRSRRLRDRGALRPPRALTPTERPSTSSYGAKSTSKKTNVMLEVLANMKRENEGDGTSELQSTTTPSPSPTSFHSFGTKEPSEAQGSGSPVSMPPPAPQMDVYARLAGQYTASAQSKRQKAVSRTPRGTGGARFGFETHGQHDEEQMDAGSAEEGGQEDNGAPYDPLIGGSSLVTSVHNDYRERLSHRSTSTSSISGSSRFASS